MNLCNDHQGENRGYQEGKPYTSFASKTRPNELTAQLQGLEYFRSNETFENEVKTLELGLKLSPAI